MNNIQKLWTTIACVSISALALAGGHEAITTPSGEAIFEANCANCHTGGIGGFFSGAPKVGDQSDWIALLPKGVEGLAATTISGIGGMPVRGGCVDCSDEDIRAAVEYIVEMSQ
jgi:cytochrome c5